MSLKPQTIPPIPDQTVKVARAAFRKGNPYLQMRDTLGTFFTDDQFAQMYPADGQPAYGEPFASTGTEQTAFGFTGEWTDANDLLYLRASSC